ncbi:hypothetical protein [Amycolatopsis sp. NPDC051371]|uniref:YobI family P-loop NTPase n=1 Tax=Amycolatopsis sp. NPDC051371 TaxID=3155800 RepID=UPI00344085DA
MTDADDEPTGDASPAAVPYASVSSDVRLQTLAPGYVAEQHETYLRHLRQAVDEKKNLNIALTGRYGAGKSSVLDEFVVDRTDTLRIAISTLGPDAEGAPRTLTNRIQKELVKQLLYRASPRKLPLSRFNRIVPLSKLRATLEAMAVVGVVAGALALLGWLPHLAGTGPGHNGWLGVLSGVGFASLAVVVLATLRIVIYGRFVVSDVSAAGAAVKLTQRSSTYFDEYLEEIVYFFDMELPGVVVFEDLDRFDDPHIFEALRELNTLLNNTAKRVEKKKPVRFVYAIKDSLFEKLGLDPEQGQGDSAQVETVRANRTKFFDIVIPVVPFISHHNARELLADLLQAGKVTDIDRDLITLVAQHVTDMRLLKNIYNEYIVFAQRLLVGDRTAPGLTASNLFAVVVYKNIHLKDFEEIARRGSALDVLYARRQDLVQVAIDGLDRRKRGLLDKTIRVEKMGPVAEQLGDRLVAVGQAFRDQAPNGQIRSWPYVKFRPGTVWHSEDEVRSCDFWRAVAENNEISIWASTDKKAGSDFDLGTLQQSRIQALFPEAADAGSWASIDEREVQAMIKELDSDIAFVRGADFAGLAANTRFTLPVGQGDNFATIVGKTMASQLARQLVMDGYLDRNFALYAAQFYGRFSGVDVATFIVQHAQTNTMNVDYKFSGQEAVANLLTEAPPDFIRTASAYNVDVLNYLLERDDEQVEHIARSVARDFDNDAQKLLRRYFNLGSQPARLAALLSSVGWSPIFMWLADDEGLPERIRPALVDAALKDANPGHSYELDGRVRGFIAANYPAMEVFTVAQPAPLNAKVVEFVKKAGVVFPGLAEISDDLRDEVVRERLYLITAENLRIALGIDEDVSIDQLRADANVYEFCLASPNVYLNAAENDVATPYAVVGAQALVEVLTTVTETWKNDLVRRLISMAAPSSRLERLDAVPSSCWRDLAAQELFEPSVRNIKAYLETVGEFGEELAGLLTAAGRIGAADGDEDDRAHVAIAVLNAADVIQDPLDRVTLVQSLHLTDYLVPSEIEPESGELLTLLLEHDLVKDDLESFMRFREVGWAAIRPAIARSSRFADFVTPELVGDFIENFVRSNQIPVGARDRVIDNLEVYVPGNDAAALAAAGQYALERRVRLPLDQLLRIASVTGDVDLVVRSLTVVSPFPEAQAVAGVLGALGVPYSYLETHVETKFEVPADDAHQKLFAHLRSKGVVVSVTRARTRERLNVKLT